MYGSRLKHLTHGDIDMADLGLIGDTKGDSCLLFGGSVSGLVYDEVGNPTRHRVLAFDRVTGQPSGGAHSDPVTGTYLISTNILFSGKEHFVVELSTNPAYNARNHDRVIPV